LFVAMGVEIAAEAWLRPPAFRSWVPSIIVGYDPER
jgi:hypothetical protein